jgi:flagellar hook assembly protein FlgD
LETPVISADSSNGRITVSWDEVDNASGYKVDIYKGDVSSSSTATPLESVILDEYETDYTTTDISVVKDQTYTVKVQALGKSGGKYANSNLRRATVTGVAKGSSGSSLGRALDAPKNLYTDLDDGFLTISWDTVDDAADYTVELYRPNGKLLESDTTQYTEYNFTEELDEKGTYKVQVQSNPKSSSKYKSSAFTTKSVKVSSGSSSSSGRLDAPEFSVSRSSDAVKIRWETVSKAEQYDLEILDPSGKVAHSITLEEYDDNPYYWYGDMLKKGTWKVRMKAIDEDGDYKDSAYNTKSIEVSSGRLETPSINDVEVDGNRALIEINTVDDAASYQINIDGKNYSFEPTGIAAIRGTPVYRSGQLSKGKHTVKVRARAGEDSSLDTSDWSNTVSFEVD